MKIFNGQFYYRVCTIIFMMHGVLSAQEQTWLCDDEPSTILPAYRNHISQVSSTVGSDDQFALTFICQNNPICMYTPLTYEDCDELSRTKTYYFPCMSYTDEQRNYFFKDLPRSLKKMGIDVSVEEIKNNKLLYSLSQGYGLRISFTVQPGFSYDIVKCIDTEKKSVSFNFAGKI